MRKKKQTDKLTNKQTLRLDCVDKPRGPALKVPSYEMNDDDDDDEMMMMMMTFWVFDFYVTFICYREYFKLNCYISKKVQKNFLMGFKIW